MENEEEKSNNSRNIIIGLLLIIAFGVLYMVFRNSSSSVKANTSTISGEVDFNGVKPEDAHDPDLGEIVLTAREHNTDNKYEDTDVPISFADESHWIWEDAESGIAYDLVAEVYYKDQLIKKSQRAVATAPAKEVILVFNITNDDIPEDVDTDSDSDEPATISGIYRINGYIPTGSTIRVYGRNAAEKDAKFVEVRRDIPAASSNNFSYDEAVYGETYEIQAELYTAGDDFIGQSPYIKVTAPAKNEEIIINSNATPPSQKATISGNIDVNGPFDQSSTILLLQRKHGDSDYSVVTRYDAEKSVDFKWKDAKAGTTYDITTALQVGGNNTATGNVVTVVAPAKSVDLELDTGFNLPAPNETARIDCGTPDSTNHYNAKIEMQQFENAERYHLEVGTSAGSNNIFNESVEPRTAATVFVTADSPYFTRYAYTACSDCNINDQTNWSGWSPTIGFKCPQ